MVGLLIGAGADVNAVVPGDENALINAARNGHFEVARHLIDHGADVNALVREHDRIYTALREARRKGHLELERLLRQHGATR